jgi:glycerol-3-phosphate dehydrogenase (NAD(P)+)
MQKEFWNMTKIAVLGEGAWGSAIATILANNGYQVKLWCHASTVAQDIALNRSNSRYFKGIEFHNDIIPYTTIKDVCSNVSVIFVTIPVQYLRSVLLSIKPFIHTQRVVMLCKGIEQKHFLFPTQIVQDVMGYNVSVGVIAGPTFATEIVEHRLSGAMVASYNESFFDEIRNVLQTDYFRLYESRDIIGIQACSALKNVAALATGMLVGGKYGDNTKAFFLTQFLKEISRFVVYCGGSVDTIYGLAGIGDLILTSYGPVSKNFQFGKRLAEGESLESILQKTDCIPEGVNTVHAVHEISKLKKLDLPLCNAIHELIHDSQLGIDHITERIVVL